MADVNEHNILVNADNNVPNYGLRNEGFSTFEPTNSFRDSAMSVSHLISDATPVEGVSNRLAVETNSVCFKYRSSSKQILDKISLHIPEGTIYGLLGPSGCGKTSLLRCLLGQLKLSSGCISMLGHTPGSKGSTIPGPGVGYMPQDVALYMEFTVSETINYFGRLFGMKRQDRVERTKFLLNFLDLQEPNKLIRELSGGQKRRVSLAAALVHSPPLLILDEPTVGVDPLLRQNIWNHLVDLAATEKMTIVITTHYVEEARRADTVGLMRGGSLLVEANPEDLLKEYGLDSLEAVFLEVCMDNDKPLKLEVIDDGQDAVVPKKLSDSAHDKPFYNSNTNPGNKSFHQTFIFTLLIKNLIRLKRNIPLQLFHIVMPALQICLFCLCIGNEPKHLGVAVFNPDPFNYSRLFLSQIDKDALQLRDCDSYEDAINEVKMSNSWAALVFDQNFTEFMGKRIKEFSSVDNETIEKSTVHLYADMTEYPIQTSILNQLLIASTKFTLYLVEETKLITNPEVVGPLVKLVDPTVYGDLKPTFRDFMAPGFILGITYVLAVGLTALAFVVERKEGLLERTFVAGVKSHHILFAHIIVQFGLILVQSGLLLFFVFVMFEIELRGSLAGAWVLVLLQGITGMSFGFLISSLCYEEQSAIMLAMGSFYPNLMLSGMVWPLEGMPYIIRQLAYGLPQTMAIKAIRSIISRGLDITFPQVYVGFLATGAWLLFFNVAAILVFTFKRR